jgi:chemotaxis protein CheY-P-specific phosphatase CheC
MNSQREGAVKKVFCEMLEKCAFIFAETAAKDEIDDVAGEYVCVAMSFSGAWRGTMQLALPRPLCAVIAANMLGLEPDDEEAAQAQDDAVKELLNVTCGNVLTTLAGTEAVFSLSAPKTQVLPAAEWKALLQSPESVGFTVEEQPALLRLTIDDEAGAHHG